MKTMFEIWQDLYSDVYAQSLYSESEQQAIEDMLEFARRDNDNAENEE